MKRRYDIFYAPGRAGLEPGTGPFGLMKTGKWRTDWKARFWDDGPPLGRIPVPTLLIHGVSVGEINATRELVALLTAPEAPPLRLVVSATTNTGFRPGPMSFMEDRLPVVRFPFDFSWMVGRFFDALRPDAVALMELELWPKPGPDLPGQGNPPLRPSTVALSDSSYRHYRWTRPFVRVHVPDAGRCGSPDGGNTPGASKTLGTPRNHITVHRHHEVGHGEVGGRGARGSGTPGSHGHRSPPVPWWWLDPPAPGEEALLLAGKAPGGAADAGAPEARALS